MPYTSIVDRAQQVISAGEEAVSRGAAVAYSGGIAPDQALNCGELCAEEVCKVWSA
jgi:hypothetical protein